MKNRETIYYCPNCKYRTEKKFNYDCHIKSKKHIQEVEESEGEEKVMYLCEACNYSTNLSSNYSKHLNTNKHKMNVQLDENRSSEGVTLTQEMFYELMKDKKELIQSNKQLMNIIENGTHHITNNINSNNNTNNFNLNFFLNETCKDAINMTDFVESIQVKISDLKKLGNKGYVEGISDLMISRLNELDVSQRPIHSTDAKRQSIYIKDDGVWEKDDKDKIISVLWMLAKLETRALEDTYKKEYPKCETDRDSREHEEYWRIYINALGGEKNDLDEKQKKVIKKIVQHVAIDKTKFY